VVWPVFKTATETPPAAPVGSIPTRSRHSCSCALSFGNRDSVNPRRVALVIGLGNALAVCLAFNSAVAQDSILTRPAATSADTLARRTSPMNAFFRSFLLPGWGQAKLNRKLTGGIFVAWEGVTLGMSLKTRHELAYLRRTGSGRAEDKRREHEDWIVLLVFNHLFAGLEAYVSAHLADFPGDLKFQAVPGGFGASLSLPVRIR
jgi:hypothetical protein